MFSWKSKYGDKEIISHLFKKNSGTKQRNKHRKSSIKWSKSGQRCKMMGSIGRAVSGWYTGRRTRFKSSSHVIPSVSPFHLHLYNKNCLPKNWRECLCVNMWTDVRNGLLDSTWSHVRKNELFKNSRRHGVSNRQLNVHYNGEELL